MTHHILLAAALLLPFTGNLAAGAADRTVHQKGRRFSSAEVTVSRNEPIVFLNDDTVPHNVMSTSVDNGFDLGSQNPGSATPVSFSVAGTVVVICAIHPRMRMVVNVTN
jgi:plastocyanin